MKIVITEVMKARKKSHFILHNQLFKKLTKIVLHMVRMTHLKGQVSYFKILNHRHKLKSLPL